MRCLRCGTNVESTHTFCPPCLEEIEKDPVARDAVVMILPRPKKEPPKPRIIKPEVLLLRAKKRQKTLSWVCFGLICLSLILGALLVWQFLPDKRPIGQTYQPKITQTEDEP